MPLYMLICLIALGVAILGLVLLFLNELQDIKLERRFVPFTMKSNTERPISFFDLLAIQLKKSLKKFSNVLKKSHVAMDYAKHYEKYITYEEKEEKESIDFITIKLFMGLGFVLLHFITIVLKLSPKNIMTSLIAFFIGFFLLDIALAIQFKKKRKEIESDLLQAIIIMNNSFKSGKNIMQAISTVKNELDGPIADEFKKIYMDITYGLSLEVVFERFYERVKLEDAKSIASSLTLLNKTGGNIVKVFSTIEKSFFSKKRMQDELSSLTAASVFVFRVLVALPLVFSLIIFVLNPTYFHPLFESILGFILFFFILFLYVLYIVIIKKVLKVKM